MKLGIKVSLGRDSAAEIAACHPSMAEVWFDATRADDYNNLFAFMKRQPMDVGLHYWGALPDGILTNIAYPDARITKPSLALMKTTIDVAARNRFSYVNIHSDRRALLNVNFDTLQASIASEPADLATCTQLFIQHCSILKQYADDRGVVLTIESVPLREPTQWDADRLHMQIIKPFQLPIDTLTTLSQRKFAIANDFCHTASNVISDDPAAVWQFLYDTTKTLAAATRLIHFGFIVPPYNGVDNHDSLDNPVLDTPTAIPNIKQMIKLLLLFQNRDDVWILVEPKTDHVKNYFLAGKILQKAGVLTK